MGLTFIPALVAEVLHLTQTAHYPSLVVKYVKMATHVLSIALIAILFRSFPSCEQKSPAACVREYSLPHSLQHMLYALPFLFGVRVVMVGCEVLRSMPGGSALLGDTARGLLFAGLNLARLFLVADYCIAPLLHSTSPSLQEFEYTLTPALKSVSAAWCVAVCASSLYNIFYSAHMVLTKASKDKQQATGREEPRFRFFPGPLPNPTMKKNI